MDGQDPKHSILVILPGKSRHITKYSIFKNKKKSGIDLNTPHQISKGITKKKKP